MHTPSVLLITGIMAAGKSTIAQAVAERLPRSVHLRGDLFRRLIVNGRVAIEPPLSPEASAQLRLRYRIAASVAEQYGDTGFTVVCQDIIVGSILADVVALYRKYPLYLVVLCPTPAVALERDRQRHKQTYSDWTPDALHDMLMADTPRLGLWLDNSALTVDKTVDQIFARLDEALVERPHT